MALAPRPVLAGHHRSDVRGDGVGGGKGPYAVVVAGLRRVGYDHPAIRHDDLELESSLEVGLVEACVDAVRIVALELAVKVDTPVDRVAEPVQSGPVVHVASGGDDLELVFGLEILDLQPPAIKCPGRNGASVEGRSLDRRPDELDERGGTRLGALEGGGGGGQERLLTGREVEAYVVPNVRQERGAAPRLIAGQVVTDVPPASSRSLTSVRAEDQRGRRLRDGRRAGHGHEGPRFRSRGQRQLRGDVDAYEAWRSEMAAPDGGGHPGTAIEKVHGVGDVGALG